MDLEKALRDARKAERAEIVAWLRARYETRCSIAAGYQHQPSSYARALRDLADELEMGLDVRAPRQKEAANGGS